jgi:hypothetical protein
MVIVWDVGGVGVDLFIHLAHIVVAKLLDMRKTK